MTQPLIVPNLHVALVHFPLALLVVGVLIELFGSLWPNSSFRTAGRWMILLGALAAIPVAYSGIYALANIGGVNSQTTSWISARASSHWLSIPGAWQLMWSHLVYTSIGTLLSASGALLWLACSDGARRALYPLFLAMVVGGLGCMMVGASKSGEAIYRHGLAVQINGIPATTAFDPTPPWPTNLPPVPELHVILAGITVAVALAAAALSLRRISATSYLTDTRPTVPFEQTFAESTARGYQAANPVTMVRSFNPGISVAVEPFAPAARFWMLTCLLGIITASGGLFWFASDGDSMAIAKKTQQPLAQVIWSQIKPPDGHPAVNRLLGHLAAGATIIVLPLLLALMSRFGPRSRLVVGFFAMILIAAAAVQLWLGILLLLDSSDGPINHFNSIENVGKQLTAPGPTVKT